MLQKFLSYFGNPLYTLIGDGENGKEYLKKDADISSAVSKKMDLNDCLEFNKKHPLCLSFTPNGNYGDVISLGQNISGARVKEKHGNLPYYHALIFDFDIKDTNYKTHEELWHAIIVICNNIQFRFSFVVKTPGGFHAYTVFNASDKVRISEKYGLKILDINLYFIRLLGADKSGFALNKTLRVPTSLHRKSTKPLETYLYQCDKSFNLLDTFDEESFIEITYDQLVKFIERNDAVLKEEKLLQKTTRGFAFTESDLTSINSIDFKELLPHLPPRIYKGKRIKYEINSDDSMNIIENDKIIRTDGYRLWKKENVINNFSYEQHDRSERPVGNVLSFLTGYLGSRERVIQFLKDQYGIATNARGFLTEGEDLLQVISYLDSNLIFTTSRVILEEGGDKGGTVQKKLFGGCIEIVGRAVKFDNNITSITTTAQEQSAGYICKISSKDGYISCCTTKTEFNRHHQQSLFFYGSDNDLGLFYEILANNDMPEYKTVSHNGYHYGCCFLGGKEIFRPEGLQIYNGIPTNYTFSLPNGIQQISVKEMSALLQKTFSDEASVIGFCAVLAMAGMNIWSKETLNPCLLITGLRGSGKSTLKNCLMHAIGYTSNVRSYSLGTTTKQPLSVSCLDPSIASIDELTGKIHPDKEAHIRNIINKDGMGVGMLGMRNIEGHFAAPLIVTGERTFQSESLNNRCMIVGMRSKYCISDKRTLLQLERNVTCYEEVYKKYSVDSNLCEAIILQCTETLYKHGLSGRISDTWRYILFSNIFFDLGIKEEYLIGLIKKSVKELGIEQTVKVLGPTEKFSQICMAVAIRKLIMVTHDDDGGVTMSFENGYLQENSMFISDIVDYFGSMYSDENCVLVQGNEILFNTRQPENKLMYNYITNLINKIGLRY